MNEEKLIELAEQTARQLPEVTRNEWEHWAQIAKRYGLDQAVQWSERLARDVTLRPAVKRANQLIVKAINSQRKKLKELSPEERDQVFGYVSRVLAVETVRGSLQ